jgi:hypothetical protein
MHRSYTPKGRAMAGKMLYCSSVFLKEGIYHTAKERKACVYMLQSRLQASCAHGWNHVILHVLWSCCCLRHPHSNKYQGGDNHIGSIVGRASGWAENRAILAHCNQRMAIFPHIHA